MQCRDFLACLRRRDGGAGEAIQPLLGYAFAVLTFRKSGRTKDYPESLLLWHLQLQYLRDVEHPMYKVYMSDLQLSCEDLGEVSLSEFSKGVNPKYSPLDAATLAKNYKLQGVRRQQ